MVTEQHKNWQEAKYELDLKEFGQYNGTKKSQYENLMIL